MANTETWCVPSHHWSATMNGYKHFIRERQGKRSSGVTLYVRYRFDCIEVNDNVPDTAADEANYRKLPDGHTICEQRKVCG